MEQDLSTVYRSLQIYILELEMMSPSYLFMHAIRKTKLKAFQALSIDSI